MLRCSASLAVITKPSRVMMTTRIFSRWTENIWAINPVFVSLFSRRQLDYCVASAFLGPPPPPALSAPLTDCRSLTTATRAPAWCYRRTPVCLSAFSGLSSSAPLALNVLTAKKISLKTWSARWKALRSPRCRFCERTTWASCTARRPPSPSYSSPSGTIFPAR